MKKLVPLLLAVLCASACVQIPQTIIQANLKTGQFLMKAPKDFNAGFFRVDVDTNGMVRIIGTNLVVRMNPDIVLQSAMGQAEMMRAANDGAAKIAAEAISAAKKVQ